MIRKISDWFRMNFGLVRNEFQFETFARINIAWKFIPLYPKILSESIQKNQKEIFNPYMNQYSDWFGLKINCEFIRIEVSDWIGLIFQRFSTNEIEKFFRISFDWLEMNSCPKLSLYPSQCESIRQKCFKLVCWINFQSDRIRINPNSAWLSIRMNQCSDWFGLKIRLR